MMTSNFSCCSYENEKSALVVSVVSCQGLPGREPAGPDPYVKLQLLPDKQHKVKTRSVARSSRVSRTWFPCDAGLTLVSRVAHPRTGRRSARPNRIPIMWSEDLVKVAVAYVLILIPLRLNQRWRRRGISDVFGSFFSLFTLILAIMEFEAVKRRCHLKDKH